MGNKMSRRSRQVIPINEEIPMMGSPVVYLYTALLISPSFIITDEYKDAQKVKIRLYDHCMELLEFKDSEHVYCTIQYTNIENWRAFHRTGKEILSVSICEPDPFILQIGFSAKKILQEFAVDMLTHMFQYLHDLGRITHYDMTQQIAQQIAQVQLGI